MSTGRFRLAIVGTGGIAQAYAQVVAQTPEVVVTHVADVRREAAVAMAEVLGATVHSTHTTIPVDAVDGVVVCTPPLTHPDISCHFLHAGVPVLCEKPLALDSATAASMIACAGDHGSFLMMAAKYRYVEDTIRARSMIASGAIGEPLLLENSFTARLDMRNRWQSDPAVSGGGVVIDNGTHSVDIVRYLLGPVVEVLAVEGPRAQHLPVEDTALVSLRTHSGARATVDLSWSIEKQLDDYCTVYGSEGTIKLGWKGSRFRSLSSPEWMTFGDGYRKLDAMRGELLDFVQAARTGNAPRITLEDALASVQVIEAAYRSLAASAWTPVVPTVVGAERAA